MERSTTLGTLALFLASILTIMITGFMETSLQGLEINLKIDDFQRTKQTEINLTRDGKKPLKENLQGQFETD